MVTLLWIFALGACDGLRGMGETCTASEECVGDGVCLKGVCSGYACVDDAECDNGLTCGSVGGVLACVAPCAGDADCLGEQACTGDTGEAVCM